MTEDDEKMADVVKDLCHSLEHDPDRWTISTHTLKDKATGVMYWLADSSMTETWNSYAVSTVFTIKQGSKIRASYRILVAKKATEQQQKVLDSFKKPSSRAKKTRRPWYAFWIKRED